MTRYSTLGMLALFAFPSAAAAQHAGGTVAAGPPVHRPPAEVSQYDFLVGQWELVVRPKVAGLAARIHGAPRVLGTWKAEKSLDGWGIEDEMRLVDGSGNPLSLAKSIRVYDASARRWSQSTLDVYRGRFTSATAEWRDGTMQLSSRGTDAEGRPYVMRTRFYDVTPTSFKFQQDRSVDDGKTWDEAVLRIEAKRVGSL